MTLGESLNHCVLYVKQSSALSLVRIFVHVSKFFFLELGGSYIGVYNNSLNCIFVLYVFLNV